MMCRLEKIFTSMLLLALFGAAGPLIAQDQAPVAPSADSFESFSLLLDRNIFNPDRRAPRPGIPREEEPTPQATPVPETYIDLVGVWLEDGRQVAFFDGSNGIRGTKNLNESIMDLQVAQLTTTGTVLLTSGTQFALSVGDRLSRRGNDGPWNLQGSAPRTSRGGTFSSSSNNNRNNDRGRSQFRDNGNNSRSGNNELEAPAAAPANVSPEDRAAIMQRLMERRRQEMNQ